jgi:hypothetical protein
VIELASTSLLNPNRKYTPLSTEDPGVQNTHTLSYVYYRDLLVIFIVN